MGMSASQARFLCLTARKNNVEFEGQQINQQRTTLSNTSGSYYSELCNMVVPTPPSVDDYTKVSYTFDDGALTNTITSMIAKGNDEYSISYIQQWQDDYSIVSAASSIVSRTSPEEITADGVVDVDLKYIYKIGSATLRYLGDFPTDPNDPKVKGDPYLSTLTEPQLKDLKEQESYYQTMLNEHNGYGANNTDNQWYVRYVKNTTTGAFVPYFYNASDVECEGNYKDDYALKNIDCFSLGTATKTKEVLNAAGAVEKDSTGRYISIMLYKTNSEGYRVDNQGQWLDDYNFIVDPETKERVVESITYDNRGREIGVNYKTGTPVCTSYNLTTNTATDEDAYNDALNQYQYEQYQYEQKVQEINSKIEIIQQQDKNLELKLKQLDTEQSAISTEMEVVKKIVSKNVSDTFKTFEA